MRRRLAWVMVFISSCLVPLIGVPAARDNLKQNLVGWNRWNIEIHSIVDFRRYFSDENLECESSGMEVSRIWGSIANASGDRRPNTSCVILVEMSRGKRSIGFVFEALPRKQRDALSYQRNTIEGVDEIPLPLFIHFCDRDYVDGRSLAGILHCNSNWDHKPVGIEERISTDDDLIWIDPWTAFGLHFIQLALHNVQLIAADCGLARRIRCKEIGQNSYGYSSGGSQDAIVVVQPLDEIPNWAPKQKTPKSLGAVYCAFGYFCLLWGGGIMMYYRRLFAITAGVIIIGGGFAALFHGFRVLIG